MTECDELIEDLQSQASAHVRLALVATATPVREMHLELALLHGEQVRVAEDLCDGDDAAT